MKDIGMAFIPLCFELIGLLLMLLPMGKPANNAETRQQNGLNLAAFFCLVFASFTCFLFGREFGIIASVINALAFGIILYKQQDTKQKASPTAPSNNP